MDRPQENGTPEPPPVVRDKRRVDPETGELREPQETAAPEAPADPDASGANETNETNTASGADDSERQLAERTADLQRLQAEYVNYRKRVERDREAIRESATAKTLESLLPVLDDIQRAREAGELEGGFKAVAESLERTVQAQGLTVYGKAGDAFDPKLHEALMHAHSDDVDGPTCQAVLQVGYAFGSKIVRPARVAVAEPNEATSSDEQAG